MCGRGGSMRNSRAMKRPFLVVYDYGQGGPWAFVRAGSCDEVEKRFPELQVVSEVPAWMTRELELQIEARESYDLDEPPRGLLANILKDRRR